LNFSTAVGLRRLVLILSKIAAARAGSVALTTRQGTFSSSP
jgi:hypothetical protein